jgi:hypothetical protein
MNRDAEKTCEDSQLSREESRPHLRLTNKCADEEKAEVFEAEDDAPVRITNG